jgi:hypothetical protein
MITWRLSVAPPPLYRIAARAQNGAVTPGRSLLAALAACSFAGGCEGVGARGAEPLAVADLAPYRGQRPLLWVRHGTGGDLILDEDADVAKLIRSLPVELGYDLVVFNDGLVLGEEWGCRFAPGDPQEGLFLPGFSVRIHRLPAGQLSTLKSFLAGIPKLETRWDCSHSGFYLARWTVDGNSQTIEAGCDGRYEPEVKDTSLRLLELAGMGDLPTRCDPHAERVPNDLIWRLVGKSWDP